MTEHPTPGAMESGPTGEDQPFPTAVDGHALTGRRRHRLRTAREWLLSGGSVLFFGPAGVGKSIAVDLVTAAAGRSRVLRCMPVRSDAADNADQPLAALASLLSSVTTAELGPVPAARRRLLAAVVQRDAEPVTMAAVRLAVLNLLRVLARNRPVLLSVDDLQWLDEASADVLRFVAQRVEDLPVVMAAAELVSPGCLPLRRPLCPPPLLVVGLGSTTAV